VRLKMIFAITLLAVLSFGAFQQTTSLIVAQERVIARAYGTVNVRSGPSTSYPVVGQLSADAVVNVTGRSDDENNWLQIEFNGQNGWVAFFTVTVEGDTSSLPVRQLQTPVPRFTMTSPATPPGNGVGDPFIVLIRRINVRSGPGTDHARLGTLQPGDTAPIIGRTSDNQWLQIDYQGRNGWVSYFVVGISGLLEGVRVVDASEFLTSSPTATRVPPTPMPGVVMLLTRFNANLRALPSFSAEIRAVVPFDTRLPVERRTESGNWLRVTYNGETGWLAAVLVDVQPHRGLDTLPVESENRIATDEAVSP
jgi:uncharacterized protein YraI